MRGSIRYHAIRRLSRQDVPVFLTDSAVGTQEENNLRHLVANLGRELPRELVVPFLTSKHSLDFCLSLREAGAAARVHVARGARRRQDRGPAALRRACLGSAAGDSRATSRDLTLGGWANPHAGAAQQVDFLLDERFCAEFYLTQVVSHVDLDPVKRFLDEIDRAARADSGDVLRLLLPQRQSENVGDPEHVHARSGSGADRGIR